VLFAKLIDSYRLATKVSPPTGYILVHNHPGSKSFRAWWTKPGEEFVSCDCGWRPDLGEHYRVERAGPLVARRRRIGIRPAA
jgi:hypothetical protein